MTQVEMTQEQVDIVRICLEDRRDAIIRRLISYRKMEDVLNIESYDSLVRISEVELEQILNLHHQL